MMSLQWSCDTHVTAAAEHVQGYVNKDHDFVKEFDDQSFQDEKVSILLDTTCDTNEVCTSGYCRSLTR